MAAYLAPDIIPKGERLGRFSTDIGLKKTILNGKGEFYLNAIYLFNNMPVRDQNIGKWFLLEQ